MSDIGPLIAIEDVTKEYLAGRVTIRALVNVSLNVNWGEFVSLVGPSGAGKSTLTRILIAEDKPSKGRVVIAGRDLKTLKKNDLPFYRRKVGVVFQDFKLLPNLTVWENVAFALEVADASSNEIKTKIPKILELVNLAHRATNYPDELSGGEKQRVAIARALVHSPKILIADEPTGNLDPTSTWEIIDLLVRINQSGTIVILATHNQAVVDRLRRRVVAMKDGSIVSDQQSAGYTDVSKKAVKVMGN